MGQVSPDNGVDASGPVTSMVSSVAVDALAALVFTGMTDHVTASGGASMHILCVILCSANTTDRRVMAGGGPVAQ